MIRRFQFEAEIYDSMSCLPMAARRKLDRLGVKIGLEQWQKLARGERRRVDMKPANGAVARGCLRTSGAGGAHHAENDGARR